MRRSTKLFLVRLSPVLFIVVALIAYVVHVEGANRYALLNVVPVLLALALAAYTLVRGQGRWHGAGWQWLLATLGYAIPAVGLSLYLHYGWSVDRDTMASDATDPFALFRYLPLYTMFAGAIGFAIGWIIGRNV
jgi:hypothetical protein